jgi:hypothetical protein
MVSRAEKNDKWLKSQAKKLHDSTFPEDTLAIVRPTDADLYSYVDKFTEDYSWREDILKDEILLHVFNCEEQDSIQLGNYNILRWLREKKYIQFSNADENGWILINNVKDDELNKLLGTLHPEIIPADITYSAYDRVVIFNGKRHKMHEGSDSHKIFHLLATHPNERISKARVWRAINQRSSTKRQDNNFSSLIKRVRTSVGATKQEISLKDTVVLNATVKITD